MTTLTLASAFVGALCFAGCTSAPSTDLGDVQISTYTLHVAREGDTATAGNMPRFVIKPTAGRNPTSIHAWVGLEDASSAKVLAVYDDADGDFDIDLTVPTPMPDGSALWLDVETTGTTMTGSITLK